MSTKIKRQEIEKCINDYLEKIENITFKLNPNDKIKFFTELKRRPIDSGPYPHVSIFEAANRIMTDLTILFGLRMLFNSSIPEINFDEYSVEFGHEDNAENDILAENENQKLIGEAFNVSRSFFQGKKLSALRKMRKTAKINDKVLLVYNQDAIKKNYKPKPNKNEYHLVVNIEMELKNTAYNKNNIV